MKIFRGILLVHLNTLMISTQSDIYLVIKCVAKKKKKNPKNCKKKETECNAIF